MEVKNPYLEKIASIKAVVKPLTQTPAFKESRKKLWGQGAAQDIKKMERITNSMTRPVSLREAMDIKAKSSFKRSNESNAARNAVLRMQQLSSTPRAAWVNTRNVQ